MTRRKPSAASPIVSTEWLAANLGRRNVRVVDGSWHMPQLKRDARAEFAQAHIPGAVFFDIDAIADRLSSLPHMLPSAVEFARSVGQLGIGSPDRVIVYDSRGVVSAARVWWTFRVFGHDRVAVLDGGFPRWRAEGRPAASGEATPRPRRFTARLRRRLVRELASMRGTHKPRREQGHGRVIADDLAVSDSRFVVNYSRMSGDGRLIFGGGER